MSSERLDRFFDLKALEAFQVAMATGSMTKAAAQLGIGQPTVTKLVRDLESAAGFALFHRNGPRIAPTDQGLQFYDEVKRFMGGMSHMRDRALAIRQDRVPAIDIAATPTMAAGLVAPVLARMSEDLPLLINVQSMDAEHVARALGNRTADFGLSAFPLEYADLKVHAICQSRLVAAVAKGSDLDCPDALPLATLGRHRLITVANAFRIRRAIEDALAVGLITPPSSLATNSSLNAMMAARAGLGVAIIDPVTAYGIPVDDIVIRPLETDIPYHWGLFSAADRAIPSPFSSITDAFRHACGALIPDAVFSDP